MRRNLCGAKYLQAIVSNDGAFRDRKCCFGHLSRSATALRRVRPGEERQNRPRVSHTIAVIKVVCAGCSYRKRDPARMPLKSATFKKIKLRPSYPGEGMKQCYIGLKVAKRSFR